MQNSNLKANIHIVKFQSVKNSYFKFLQGNVATLCRWSWKTLRCFVANISKTLHINFYQNLSSIVEVMIKQFWCVFMPHSVYQILHWTLQRSYEQWRQTDRQRDRRPVHSSLIGRWLVICQLAVKTCQASSWLRSTVIGWADTDSPSMTSIASPEGQQRTDISCYCWWLLFANNVANRSNMDKQ